MRDSPRAIIPAPQDRKHSSDELFASWNGPGDLRTLSGSLRRRLKRVSRKTRDAELRRRYRTILLLADGWRSARVAQALGCARSTVYHVRRRFMEDGEAGLVDRREDNGPRKVDPFYLRALHQVLEGVPSDFGWRRPTWTREALILTLVRQDLPRISPPTMSRALRRLHVRRGRPRPQVECPWPQAQRLDRLLEIHLLIDHLGPRDLAFWEDEVDVHLNPKLGLDYMLPGTQREVLTPGQNKKAYIAAAREARSRRLIWVTGWRKNSRLFLGLLGKLLGTYPEARTIHLIVDNFKIHDSQQTQTFLAGQRGRIQIHFLPPYDPDDQPMDRVFTNLHAEVTRNHRHGAITPLVEACHEYLRRRDRARAHVPSTQADQRNTVQHLRTAI